MANAIRYMIYSVGIGLILGLSLTFTAGAALLYQSWKRRGRNVIYDVLVPCPYCDDGTNMNALDCPLCDSEGTILGQLKQTEFN